MKTWAVLLADGETTVEAERVELTDGTIRFFAGTTVVASFPAASVIGFTSEEGTR